MPTVKKIKIIMVIICVIFLIVCSDTHPSMIPVETVDLAEDSLDGQWDVWLEIRQSGNCDNIYTYHLRFNVSASSVDEDYGFSVYRVKEAKSPERFSGMTGFLPEYVDSLGLISVEGSDFIHIWFDEHPEYPFVTYLAKNDDGKIIGTGKVLQNQEDETIAALEMVLSRKW